MAGSKKFFHDRSVLLLVSINAFFAVAGSLYILLQLGGTHPTGLIVQYRQNLGLSGYTSGGSVSFFGFILFLMLGLGFHVLLAKRVFHIRRQLALAVLGMGTMLAALAIVVSGALLTV